MDDKIKVNKVGRPRKEAHAVEDTAEENILVRRQLSIAEMFPDESGSKTSFGFVGDENDPFGIADLSDEEALERLRTADTYSALPNPPKIPGYHLYWATTANNNKDVFEKRQTGYTFVKPEEVPGFRTGGNRDGRMDGDVVNHNEMILMKIPERLYQLYMTEKHHTMPREAEEGIKYKVLGKMRNSGHGDLARDVGDGITSLGEKRKAPIFRN